MPNPLFVNDLALRIQSVLAAARHADELKHPGLTGTVRELLVRQLLQPLLPPTIAVGRGKIVDHVGNASDEIDIVLYDRAVLPALLYGEAEALGVFPVEACRYALQVKSTSSKRALGEALKQGRSLARLVYLREACGPLGNPIGRVIPGYFAFRSDLAMPSTGAIPEVARWRAEHDESDLQHEDVRVGADWRPVPYPPLRVLCVVGQGYGFYSGSHYTAVAADSAYGEVAAFVIGIANSLLRPRTARHGLPFGYYLGGLSQADAEPRPGSPEEAEALLLALGERQQQFDANDAARAIFDERLKHRGPDTVLGNIEEVGRALEGLEAAGAIRRVDTAAAGAHKWEYVDRSARSKELAMAPVR
jgi:hypothetical protein